MFIEFVLRIIYQWKVLYQHSLIIMAAKFEF